MMLDRDSVTDGHRSDTPDFMKEEPGFPHGDNKSLISADVIVATVAC